LLKGRTGFLLVGLWAGFPTCRFQRRRAGLGPPNPINMTSEQQEYLDQECADFEKCYLQGQRFWRAPVYALKDTSLFSFFERFCELFPDHATEYNCLFYLIGQSWGGYSVLYICTHFEHGSLDEVRELIDFLGQFAPSFVPDGRIESISLELLDNYGEKLQVCFSKVIPSMIALLQERSTRATA
jgi:hypothetical protein